MAAKKKVSPQKTSVNIDLISEAPEEAMSILFQAEAQSTAEMFKNEEREQAAQNLIANAATAEEVQELMSLNPLLNPKKKKGSKK